MDDILFSETGFALGAEAIARRHEDFSGRPDGG